jgi:hypothetical protein
MSVAAPKGDMESFTGILHKYNYCTRKETLSPETLAPRFTKVLAWGLAVSPSTVNTMLTVQMLPHFHRVVNTSQYYDNVAAVRSNRAILAAGGEADPDLVLAALRCAANLRPNSNMSSLCMIPSAAASPT